MKFISLNNDKAAVAVETVFLMPIIVLFVIGILNLSITLVIQNALNIAVREAAIFSVNKPTGNVIDVLEEKILKVLNKYSLGLIDPSKLEITIRPYESLENKTNPEPFDDLNEDGNWNSGEYWIDVNGDGIWNENQEHFLFIPSGRAVKYLISYEHKLSLIIQQLDLLLRAESPIVNLL